VSGGCPCGLGPSLEACCGRYLAGAPAPTAEALMRSRYTAYVVRDVAYVVATHAPAGRDGVDVEATRAWSERSSWHGLEVLATEQGGADDDAGVVEFVARFSLPGAPVERHHERSRFVRAEEGGVRRWYYEGGELVRPRPAVRDPRQVGRNEPCPCGSGRKFKKCHGGG
jgi:SEC-C motif-containing protein